MQNSPLAGWFVHGASPSSGAGGLPLGLQLNRGGPAVARTAGVRLRYTHAMRNSAKLGWRCLALCVACSVLLCAARPAPQATPSPVQPDTTERDALTKVPCATTTTRVEAQITVNGQQQTYHFATLYNCVAWILTVEGRKQKVDWPPKVSMRDLSAKSPDGKPVMIPLPFDALRLDKDLGLALVAMPGDHRQSYGPWVVATDEELLQTTWPNALLFSSADQAAQQAADWHGSLSSWDDAVVNLAGTFVALSQASGGGGSAQNQSYQEQVMPDTGDKAPIIPGAQDELRH